MAPKALLQATAHFKVIVFVCSGTAPEPHIAFVPRAEVRGPCLASERHVIGYRPVRLMLGYCSRQAVSISADPPPPIPRGLGPSPSRFPGDGLQDGDRSTNLLPRTPPLKIPPPPRPPPPPPAPPQPTT